MLTFQGKINIRFSNRDHAGALHRAVLSGKEEDVEFLLNIGKGNHRNDEEFEDGMATKIVIMTMVVMMKTVMIIRGPAYSFGFFKFVKPGSTVVRRRVSANPE